METHSKFTFKNILKTYSKLALNKILLKRILSLL